MDRMGGGGKNDAAMLVPLWLKLHKLHFKDDLSMLSKHMETISFTMQRMRSYAQTQKEFDDCIFEMIFWGKGRVKKRCTLSEWRSKIALNIFSQDN